jgi:hypothetical protein
MILDCLVDTDKVYWQCVGAAIFSDPTLYFVAKKSLTVCGCAVIRPELIGVACIFPR